MVTPSEQGTDPSGGSATDDGGRVALVTGAASGIGAATARRFGRDGLRVACFDLDEAGVESTASAVRDDGGEAIAIAGDVSDEVAVKTCVATTLESFGTINVLANVAGVGHYEHSSEESLSAWNRTVGINLTGTFLMCRDALPALLENRGVIVNVASIAGLAGHAYGAAYSSSKGAVVSLTKSLAVEYAARGVRVNAVCPGGVLTPIINSFAAPEGADNALVARAVPLMGALLEPEEIANAIAFLASESMPNTSGAVLVVDGCTIA